MRDHVALRGAGAVSRRIPPKQLLRPKPLLSGGASRAGLAVSARTSSLERYFLTQSVPPSPR